MHGGGYKILALVLVTLGAVAGLLFSRGKPPIPPKPRPQVELAKLAVQYVGEGLPRVHRPAVELIFDSSYSMRKPLDERTKLDAARDVLKGVVNGLSDDVQIGLRMYGHWGVWRQRRDAPDAEKVAVDDPLLTTDSDLCVPMNPLDAGQREKLIRWLNWAQPRGKTPLVYSLSQATDDFTRDHRAARIIVLLSDGEETCGGELADLADVLHRSSQGYVIHVVGFAVDGTPAEEQLREIARLGGGQYFTADTADDLTSALQSAVHSVAYDVFDRFGNTLAVGVAGGEPISLEPGRYRVRLSGSEGGLVEVQLEGGKIARITLDQQGDLIAPEVAAN